MPRYNHTRTAYQGSMSDSWYLVPDGKKRAPLFGNGPRLYTSRYSGVTEEHINLITNKDRIILLEAVAGGCFDLMWERMQTTLLFRSRENYEILSGYAKGLGLISNGR